MDDKLGALGTCSGSCMKYRPTRVALMWRETRAMTMVMLAEKFWKAARRCEPGATHQDSNNGEVSKFLAKTMCSDLRDPQNFPPVAVNQIENGNR